MRKNGFTLVELLAVIVILAIILAIAVPSITNVVNSSRLNSFNVSSKMLVKAAQTYVGVNNIAVTSGTTSYIQYSDIKTAGYINKVVDPQSNTECTHGGVYVTNNSGTYTYKGALVCDNYMDIDAYNLVTNNDFSNGTTGWSGSNATLSAANNILSVTGNGTGMYCIVTQNLNSSNSLNKKIYAIAKIKVTNNVTSSISTYILGSTGGQIAMGIQPSPNQNVWYNISGIVTLDGTILGPTVLIKVHHSYVDAATANGKVMQVDGTYGVYAFDLTAIYGAGNEPTATQMNNIMTNMGK